MYLMACATGSSFTKNLSMGLFNALFGLVLLSSCNSGDNTPTPTYAPSTSPPAGGGGGISTGGNSPIQIGNSRNSSAYTLSPPQIALNDSDAAVVVWQETVQATGAQTLWATVRSNNTWGIAIAIDSQASADARVAIDPNGRIIVVWSRNAPTATPPNNTLWARRYVNGAWLPAQPISNMPTSDNTAYPLSPAVAMDSNGNILVVWTDNGSTSSSTRSLWATHYNGSAWSQATPLSDGAHTTNNARVAVSGLDSFTVVWTQDTNVQNPSGPVTVITPNLWARRYSSGTLSAAVPMGFTNPASGDGAANLALSTNTGGDAVVVWEQTLGTQVSIAGNRYQASTGLWGTATLIETASAAATSPVVALDSAGQAVALWQQATALNNAWASVSNSGSVWQTPTPLSGQGISVQNIRLDRDASGNALAVWQQNPTGSFNPSLIARRYLPATGWDGTLSTLSLSGTDMALDVNSGGKALVVANQKTGNITGSSIAPWALLYQP